jgi:pimeloyl-ACP methyl ester carboxylesterase
MVRLGFALLALVSLSACAATRPAEGSRDLVVLVHGMGRTPLSMVPMDIGLRRAGYRVLNVGYDSGAPSVEAIAEGVGAEVEAALAEHPAPRVHFVGHSLGTVVIRWLLVHDPPPAAGRAVLLAPPNRGSHEADRWAGLVRWTFPPITELRTTGGTAVDLGTPPGVELAVIAADRDGKVLVEETCLEGAAHAVVPSAHTFVMMRPRVIGMVRVFLGGGPLPGASDAACADVLG